MVDNEGLGGLLLSLVAYAEREGNQGLLHLAIDAARIARAESLASAGAASRPQLSGIVPLNVADALISTYASKLNAQAKPPGDREDRGKSSEA